MRPAIEIKNTDKFGKVTNKWFVRIGKKRWVGFSKQEWAQNGIAWITSQLGAK